MPLAWASAPHPCRTKGSPRGHSGSYTGPCCTRNSESVHHHHHHSEVVAYTSFRQDSGTFAALEIDSGRWKWCIESLPTRKIQPTPPLFPEVGSRTEGAPRQPAEPALGQTRLEVRRPRSTLFARQRPPAAPEPELRARERWQGGVSPGPTRRRSTEAGAGGAALPLRFLRTNLARPAPRIRASTEEQTIDFSIYDVFSLCCVILRVFVVALNFVTIIRNMTDEVRSQYKRDLKC